MALWGTDFKSVPPYSYFRASFHEEITDQFIAVSLLEKCVCVAEYFL